MKVLVYYLIVDGLGSVATEQQLLKVEVAKNYWHYLFGEERC
jgi:hypothetical protein